MRGYMPRRQVLDDDSSTTCLIKRELHPTVLAPLEFNELGFQIQSLH